MEIQILKFYTCSSSFITLSLSLSLSLSLHSVIIEIKVCACFEECAKFPSDLNNSASQRKHREWERQGPPASSNIFENKDKIVFPIVQYSMCDNFRHLQHLAFAIDSTPSFADYLKSQFIIWWTGLMRGIVTIYNCSLQIRTRRQQKIVHRNLLSSLHV